MSKILYSLKSLKALIKKENPSSACLITSGVLYEKLAWAIAKELALKNLKVILISDGEEAKKWSALENLLLNFTKQNLDRDSLVLALGGGSVGDLVGFACSVYLRGIKYIQIPTTLLAQVDSAHGGKTGINFSNFKNQIGSFYLPEATIIDERFIKTLSPHQITDGLGEIIKAGFIKDTTILDLLKKETVASIPNSPNLKKIIKKSIEVKDYFIKNDLKDKSIRQILNVGHTLGHAIELKYKMSHGLSVLYGILLELEMSEKNKLTKKGTKEEFFRILESLDIKLSDRFVPDTEKVLHDKKISGDSLIWPIIVKTGQAKLFKIRTKDFLKLAK